MIRDLTIQDVALNPESLVEHLNRFCSWAISRHNRHRYKSVKIIMNSTMLKLYQSYYKLLQEDIKKYNPSYIPKECDYDKINRFLGYDILIGNMEINHFTIITSYKDLINLYRHNILTL